MTVTEFFNKLANGATWSAGVSFKRANNLPLDLYSVFASKADLDTYASSNPVAYPGQIVAVVSETEDAVYYIDHNMTPQPMGAELLVDGNSIVKGEDNTLALVGFAEAAEGAQPRKNANGKIEWVVPSTDTVDGLQNAVAGIQSDITNLQGKDTEIEEKIGDVAEGKTVVQMISEAQEAATYDDTALASRVKAIEDDYLKGADKTELETAISTAKSEAISEAVATVLGEGTSEDFDTLKEVADWILSDTTGAAALMTRVTTIENDYLKGADKTELQGEIDALETFIGTLPEGAVSTNVIAYIQEVVDGLKIGDYAKATELAALAERVTAVETALTALTDRVKALEDVGAEKNIINSADENEFTIDADRTIGGITSSTNAGTYTATFTPKADYCWADGTTASKNATWTIGKKTGTLTVSKTSIDLTPSALTGTFTIGGEYDGTLSVKSNNTGVATVSRSGNTVTVSHVNKTTGTATITVSCTAGTNYTAPANKTVTVNAKFVSTTLNENDWSVISDVSAEGTGANYWSVGDCKSVLVNGTVGTLAVNGTYWVYILGFNHNSSREGTGIHFGGFKTAQTSGTDICLCDSKYNSYSTDGTKYFNMNHSSNTNSGGWKGCDLRYDVLGSTNSDGADAGTTTATSPVANTLMAALPSDLRAVMKQMTKYTDNTGGGSDTASYVTATKDYLPLLSEYEVHGARSYANSAEQNYQTQYAYYSSGNSKIKYKHNGTTTAAYWWVRSPLYGYSASFCLVDTGGNANATYAWYSYGLAPAFKV